MVRREEVVLFIMLLASCHVTEGGGTATQDVNILSMKNVLVIHSCVTAQVPSSRSMPQDPQVVSDTNFLNACRI